MENKKRIAVVGAGIAGLTCAYELDKAGHEVVVYEADDFVGGRMSTRTKAEFPMDTGANHLAHVYTHMRKYAKELGIAWGPMHFLNYRILKKGKPRGLLDEIGWFTRFRLGIQSFIGAHKKTDFFDFSTAAKYDKDNTSHFFKTRVGQEAVDYLIDPFVSTYQFHRSDEMSLGVVYAMMRSHYKNLGDWALHQTEGGMISLPQAMADKLDVRLSTPVKQVIPGDEKIKVITENNSEKFDSVVIATTADIAQKIYSDATPEQKEILSRTEYALTVGVGFKIPRDRLGDTTIVWVPYVEGGKISGYTNEAMKGDALIKDGKTLILCWLHEDFAKTIINKTDEEIFEITKKELIKVCPYIKDASDLESYDLQRWEKAMPKFTHGHLTRVKEFVENHQGENDVYFCGDYMNAPWTEGALRCGERVAETVCKNVGES